MQLTAQQIDVFRSEGWLFLPEVFDSEEVSLLKAEAEAIYRQHRPEVWRETRSRSASSSWRIRLPGGRVWSLMASNRRL